ncbi:MAG: NAD(P)H-dependent oxidoreductase [Caldilineaceae bacterium]
MTTPLHVLGFSGSLRKASLNSGLLRAAASVLPAGMTFEIFDLNPLPFYNSDVATVGWPEPVQQFHARLAAADALLIACPEYCYSVTGALKNAFDWASLGTREKPSPLNNKPLAILGAGGQLGTARAQAHLRQIVLHNNMHPLNEPQVLLARVRDKFDDQGNLLDDGIRAQVRLLLESLAAWTQRLRGA